MPDIVAIGKPDLRSQEHRLHKGHELLVHLIDGVRLRFDVLRALEVRGRGQNDRVRNPFPVMILDEDAQLGSAARPHTPGEN